MLSLAAGTALDATPEQLIIASAAAGFDACGLRLSPDALPDARVDEIRRCLSDNGMRLLDLEVIRLRPGRPATDHLALLELAAQLDALWVLVVLEIPDRSEQLARLAELDELAASSGLRLSLEFMRFTAVQTLGDALDLVRRVPRCRVLVDALHFTRSGGRHAELSTITAQIGYLQLCDGPAASPGTGSPAELAEEARHHRLLPGHGAFDLTGLIAALPLETPVSVEVQSDRLVAAHSVERRAGLAYRAAIETLRAARTAQTDRPGGRTRGT